LVVGGFDSSADIYDPATGTFTATGQRSRAFYVVRAVLLPNGQVLIAGFTGLFNGLASAELYEPSTKAFTATGEMTARGRVTACLLSNGKVLISGDRWNSRDEIYDPDIGIFSLTGIGRTFPYDYEYMAPVSARLLTNGKVLITLWSEDLGSGAEIYDPSTGTYTVAFENPADFIYPYHYLD
jgi:hypothetical protein